MEARVCANAWEQRLACVAAMAACPRRTAALLLYRLPCCWPRASCAAGMGGLCSPKPHEGGACMHTRTHACTRARACTHASPRAPPPTPTARIKAHELRGKSKAELLAQLKELKGELSGLRVAKVTGGAPNKLSKIKIVRKAIARVLTVYRQSERAALKAKVEEDASKKKGKVGGAPLLAARRQAGPVEQQQR